MPIKILSDFDGVWTDQVLEAEAVKLFLAAEAGRLANQRASVAWRDVRDFEARVRAEPSRFGWAPDGRITAYVDEDPFCIPNAVTALIDEGADERTRLYRRCILDGGHSTLNAFADHCFSEATASYRLLHPPALVPGAASVAQKLAAEGCEIVIVSNARSEKIIGWFRAVGIDAGEGPGHALRVRGTAGKQELGDGDDELRAGDRTIRLDRPRYRAILLEEQPDFVIGDVFSLDLALPHAMRARGEIAPQSLVLRRHTHTPGWSLELHAKGTIDRVVDDVSELVGLVRERRRSAAPSQR